MVEQTFDVSDLRKVVPLPCVDSKVIFSDFLDMRKLGFPEYLIMITLFERYGEQGLYFGCGCFDQIYDDLRKD